LTIGKDPKPDSATVGVTFQRSTDVEAVLAVVVMVFAAVTLTLVG
jgi:hypothetical protein